MDSTVLVELEVLELQLVSQMKVLQNVLRRTFIECVGCGVAAGAQAPAWWRAAQQHQHACEVASCGQVVQTESFRLQTFHLAPSVRPLRRPLFKQTNPSRNHGHGRAAVVIDAYASRSASVAAQPLHRNGCG